MLELNGVGWNGWVEERATCVENETLGPSRAEATEPVERGPSEWRQIELVSASSLA